MTYESHRWKRHWRFHQEDLNVDFKFSLSRDAIAQDVLRIITAFHQCNCTDFPTFQQCWEDGNGIWLQLVCIRKVFRERYMDELFANALKIILRHAEFGMRLGAWYLLYAVYRTQLGRWPKHGIKLSPEFMSELLRFWEDCQSRDITDALTVLHILNDEDAFLYGAHTPVLNELLHFMEYYPDGHFPSRFEPSEIKHLAMLSDRLSEIEQRRRDELIRQDQITSITGDRHRIGFDTGLADYISERQTLCSEGVYVESFVKGGDQRRIDALMDEYRSVRAQIITAVSPTVISSSFTPGLSEVAQPPIHSSQSAPTLSATSSTSSNHQRQDSDRRSTRRRNMPSFQLPQ